LALVITTRSGLARPSGWIGWLAASTLMGGLGWLLWSFGGSWLRCSLALANVEVAWTRAFVAGCDFRLFMSFGLKI